MIYELLKLTLLLPVATASVERVFSDMKVVKSNLCNEMDDQWLNDCLVTYIERDVFLTISNDVILAHFQQIDKRRDFDCNVLYQTMFFLIFNIVCIIFSLKI